MRAHDRTMTMRMMAVVATLLSAVAAVGQEQEFVGQPGEVGSFESFNPVLVD